ncbi:MAG TPA: sigma-70 family RNA polymerase sigma factor [Planctomycetota bacterium]|nr:sigma-70 family RNA polymerase sigma factor [Planctomycetota bacterium]
MNPAPRFDSAHLLAHAGWVRKLARSLVPADLHQADDIAQEACLAALERQPDTDRPLASWMTTVVRNLVRENRRRSSHRGAREQACARDEALPSTSEVFERLSVHREVVEAVSELDEPYRTTILLRYFEELSARAIARRQGVPLATIKTRLARGLELLRAKLDRRHGSDGKAWLSALTPLTGFPGSLPASAAIGLLMSAQLKIALSVAVVLCGAWFFWPAQEKQASSGPEVARVGEVQAAVTPVQSESSAPVTQAPASDARVALPAPQPKVETKPATADQRMLQGSVLDANARAVSGVSVYFSVGRNTISPREFNMRAKKQAADAPSAVSDAAGHFEIAAPAVAGELLASGGTWTTVLAGLCGPGSTGNSVVVVAPHLAHSGRVIDEAGRPLGQARITIQLPRAFRLAFPQVLDNSAERGWFCESDKTGHFDLVEAPRIPGSTLTVSLDGFVPLSRAAPDESTAGLEIVMHRPLSKPGMVSGEVVDALGNPVAGANVSLGALTTTVSDEQGLFALELPKDDVRTTWKAVKPGHQPAIVAASPAVERGEVDEGEFVLLRLGPAPLSISGRVVDSEDRPLEGFKVFLVDPTFFAVEGEVPQHVEGMVSGAAGRNQLEKLMMNVPEGSDPEEVLRETSSVFWTFVRSDAHGEFKLEGLMDRAYTLAAMDPLTLLRVESEPIQAGASDARIRMPSGACLEHVRGRVVTASGEGLAGVAVTPMADVMTVHMTPQMWSTFNVGSKPVVTDAEGRFAFERMPRERVYLKLSGDDILPQDWARSQTGGIEAAAKDGIEAIVIQVALRYHVQVETDAELADEVRVLDAEGNAITINVFEGSSSMSASAVPLTAGRSRVLVVGDAARTIVVLRQGQEVRRAPLVLARGKVNTIQL